MKSNRITLTGIVANKPRDDSNFTVISLDIGAEAIPNSGFTLRTTAINVTGAAVAVAVKLEPGEEVTITASLSTHEIKMVDGSHHQMMTIICLSDPEDIQRV